jgi:predicted 2-oxoglutarate/Fe(II)-dependent dioxygenase YbiX/peroxiredoxin
MTRFVILSPGDAAPHFVQRSPANPRFAFDTVAGRYLVLCFLHGAGLPDTRHLLEAVQARRDLFDDSFAAFFAVSTDPSDESEGRLANRVPGFRVFWDDDLAVSRLYGAATVAGAEPPQRRMLWVVLDPALRVVEALPLGPEMLSPKAVAALLDRLATLPPPGIHAGAEIGAPILFLPRVFEPELCRQLIGVYTAEGGERSGFMRPADGGRTVGVHDTRHKSRRDALVTDPTLVQTLRDRILRRVVPEIARAHQFNVTRMERYLVACYDAEEGGHFAPHRDNTTPATAHRRFAVSINLNEDFEGGEVRFPEYGSRGYKAPAGAAVVFSCGLLHAVSPVAAGRRFAFLPFLYDEAAAALRARNAHSATT